MQKIKQLSSLLKDQILKLLYADELLNAILIDTFEKENPTIGDLFIEQKNSHIMALLHSKNDGNSYYTNFAYASPSDLNSVAKQIALSDKPKMLLAGKLSDIEYIYNYIGCSNDIEPNIFYKLDIPLFLSNLNQTTTTLRQATLSEADVTLIKKYTADYLEAETAAEIEEVTDHEKICSKIKQGLYILELNDMPIGMARFVGKTKNYAEITSVYIHPNHRGNHYGKELIIHMCRLALEENKTPVLATSYTNTAARKTYENLNFSKYIDYAFEFISK